MPTSGSLVLYKSSPAIIRAISEKIEIFLTSGKSKRVREKDITLLHPGPVSDFSFLDKLPAASNETLSEISQLLDGESTTLGELAELLFGDSHAEDIWAAYLTVKENTYFYGEHHAIRARTPDEALAEIKLKRQAAQRKAEQEEFVTRLKTSNLAPGDVGKLRDIIDLALHKRDTSTNLRLAGLRETPANAHAYLVKSGIWEQFYNPYPERYGINLKRTLPQFSDTKPYVQGRVDLSHLPAFAIDDAHSLDPDDAISIDGDKIWVHIADVATWTDWDDEYDRAARDQPANLYIPEGVFNMLPRGFTGLLGLGLNDTSPALSFRLEFTGTEVKLTEMIKSVVKVRRLSYLEVEDMLDDEPFSGMAAIARQFNRIRLDNGAVEINLPDVDLRLEETRVVIKPYPKLESHNMVMEFMLMTGAAVARFARENDIALIYTAQGQAEESLASDAGIAAQMAMLFKMPRSMRATKAEPQRGLGLDAYCQVTSPLRRYFDLVNHRQLGNFLSGLPPLNSAELDKHLTLTDYKFSDIRKAERASNRHWKMVYLHQHENWQGEAIVIDNDGLKYGILIPELAWYYKLKLGGNFSPGEKIKLKLISVDIPEQEARFKQCR